MIEVGKGNLKYPQVYWLNERSDFNLDKKSLIHGSFIRGYNVVHNKALTLFNTIPERLMFYLKDVLQHMGNHILVGTTRCGQFLITYSYATDLRIPAQISSFQYQYRLHWWAFKPGAPAYKVAEVQLFDNQDIRNPLTVGIAQWPNVNDKLIAYGYCDDSETAFEQEDDLESRRYYITVTTLPSLHDCKDCKAVAESFDEEDMAANWDGCIGLSCLKHGLTIHTTLDIAPPYPKFDFLTNLKIDNKIIVNTGNFLHVLSFGSEKKVTKASYNDTITQADICHRIGEKLAVRIKEYICPWKTGPSSNPMTCRRTVTRSVNKAWLNTIMDQAEKLYAFEDSEDGCEPKFKWYRRRRLADKMYEFCSDDEDMENIRPPLKIPRHIGSSKSKVKEEAARDSEDDCWKSPTLILKDWKSEKEVKEKVILNEEPKYFIESLVAKRKEIECKRIREQLELQIKGIVPTSSCITNNESERLSSKKFDEANVQFYEEHIKYLPKTDINIIDSINSSNHCVSVSKLVIKEPNNTQIPSSSASDPLPSRSDYLKIPSLDRSFINPDLSAILAEWEADSVSSLSPKSDNFIYKNGETKNEVIQSFLELIPGMTISPRSSCMRNTDSLRPESNENVINRINDSPHSISRVPSPISTTPKYSPLLVVLRTRNCNQEKEIQKPKDQDEKHKTSSKEDSVPRGVSVKTEKDTDLTMKLQMISGCSIRFDRIYIEVDEEIISTLSTATDMEDDDQGTGFHCALPLSVHGSAYAQLQMVSSHRAEKMGIHCERVYQSTLDIEQFCFKAADIICKCEGFKFWFCNDYDVEIIDVCAFNGDILAVSCLRINAEKNHPKNERHSSVNQRLFYEVRCVFIWNPSTDHCWLEAYSHLVDVTKQVHTHWAPAKQEAITLREALQNTTLFSLQPYPAIRFVAHRMFNSDDLLVPSIEEIRDHHNLIGFRLVHVPRRLRRIVEFL